ncbi:hypothetical protein C8R47DRAFT_261597 [Mycena vitilis]|nr:hypothetical protein C8R47DRAFT_261597 [Mycena vitilis]
MTAIPKSYYVNLGVLCSHYIRYPRYDAKWLSVSLDVSNAKCCCCLTFNQGLRQPSIAQLRMSYRSGSYVPEKYLPSFHSGTWECVKVFYFDAPGFLFQPFFLASGSTFLTVIVGRRFKVSYFRLELRSVQGWVFALSPFLRHSQRDVPLSTPKYPMQPSSSPRLLLSSTRLCAMSLKCQLHHLSASASAIPPTTAMRNYLPQPLWRIV